MSSIVEMMLGRLGHCNLCGMYRTLAFHDSELGWDICLGCVEDVERADALLNRMVYVPESVGGTWDGYGFALSPLGLRRPQPKEVFP